MHEPANSASGVNLESLVEQVQDAAARGAPLCIVGGGTKSFYGRTGRGPETERLEMSGHAGIVDYQPSELVITARAGTRLADLEAELASNGQMLGFEPPTFGSASTLGGVIASGLSGPGRPYRGSVRDHVLGVEIINGRGEVLRFGGQVMKNVAGYDIARLVAGSLGTLGVMTEISVRVLPRAAMERTLTWALSATDAAKRLREFPRQPWPITALAWTEECLRARVSGSRTAVDAAISGLQPDSSTDDDPFWPAVRDFRHPAFEIAPGQVLWRLSLPPAAPDPAPHRSTLLDWGGAQRWLVADRIGDALRSHCQAVGGHVTGFRGDSSNEVFDPLPAPLQGLTQRIKEAFDPARILNPGRLYSWI